MEDINKKVIIAWHIIAILVLAFAFGFIYSKVQEMPQTENEKEIVRIGRLSLVKFDEIMYYDEDTKIVYLWNGRCTGHTISDTIPVPYLAENDKPFHYNEGTGALETAP